MKKMIGKTRYLFLTLSVLLLLLAGNRTVYAAEPSIEYTLYNTNGTNSKNADWDAAGSTSQTWSEKNNYWNAISIKLKDKAGYSGGVQYATHVHNVGWSHDYNNGGDWYENGKKLLFKHNSATGFTSQDPWIEAVSVRLSGQIKDYYYVNYNARIAPLSEAYKTMLGSDVDQQRYNDGMELFNKGIRWVGFEENLSDVIGSGGTEEGIANDGGLNFAGTWGMTMPISAFRAKLYPLQAKLTIDPYGGTYKGKTDVTSSWEKANSIVDIAAPTQRGYTFTGWQMETGAMASIKNDRFALKRNKQQCPENDIEAKWEVRNKKVKMGNMSVHLIAQWEPNTYTIAYDGNENTGGKTSSQSATYNKPLGLRNNGFKRTGHTFTEWNTKADGTGTSYSEGERVENLTSKANGTVTLYAQWEKNSYTLTVNPNGGIWNKKTTNQNFTLKYEGTKAIADPTRTGYTFAGWTVTGVGSSLSGRTFTMGSANATLIAEWKPNTYTIEYHGNGATGGSTTKQPAIYDVELPLQKNGFVRPGYTFTGWNTAANAFGTSYKEEQSVKNLTTTANGTVILYAQWKANTYTIVFDGNGATEGSMQGISATVDAFPIQLPVNQFKRTTQQGESKFMGWALIPDPEGYTPEFTEPMPINRNLALNQDETVILYAIWDDCPMIETCDRYFTLRAAQEGEITEEELLSTVVGKDREDITLENRTGVQIAEKGINGSLSLYGYAAADFTGMTDSGSISISCRAVDNVGNTVYDTMTVYITNGETISRTDFQYTRFINQKYYNAPYESGGLHPKSVWLNSSDFKTSLKTVLENIRCSTPIATYRFTKEDVVQVQKNMD